MGDASHLWSREIERVEPLVGMLPFMIGPISVEHLRLAGTLVDTGKEWELGSLSACMGLTLRA